MASKETIAKLIADGVIIQDDDGTIRLTEKAWRTMTASEPQRPTTIEKGGVPRL